MTPIILLKELQKFIEESTKDIILPVRPVERETVPGWGKTDSEREEHQDNAPDIEVTARAAGVHLMSLPDKDAETNLVPYTVLQLLTGKDEQEPGEQPDSECKVRIVVVTYSENDSEGALDALNVISRIRIDLLKAGEIGSQFLLRMPLEYIVYDNNIRPYHIAEMIVTFEMPTIHREVSTYYGSI